MEGKLRIARVIIFALAVLAALVLSSARIVGDRARAAGPPAWFGVKTGIALPLPEEGAYRFAVIGDIQRGLRAFDEELARLRADGGFSFAVAVGDLVNRPSEPHYRMLLATSRESDPGIPVLTVPGNHDDRALYERFFGPRFWTARVGPDLLMGIDNSELDATPPFYDDIRRALAAPGIRHRFVFLHRPLVRDGKVRRKQFGTLFGILSEGGVKAIFAGHFHHYESVLADGILNVTNGPGGYLDGLTSRPALAVARVTAEGISVREVPVGEFSEALPVLLSGLVTRVDAPLRPPLLRGAVLTLLFVLLALLGVRIAGRWFLPLLPLLVLPAAGLTPLLTALVAFALLVMLLALRRRVSGHETTP